MNTHQVHSTQRIRSSDGYVGPIANLPSADLRARLRTHRMPHYIRVEMAAELAMREQRANQEFRSDVIQALRDEGKSERVALLLIDTDEKLNAQAKRLGL